MARPPGRRGVKHLIIDLPRALATLAALRGPDPTTALTQPNGGPKGPPHLTLDPPLWLRTRTATWSPRWPGRARDRLQNRKSRRLPSGGPEQEPPTVVVDRSPDRALAGLQLLHRIGPRLALGEALLGLQQPMHHDQLAHQVVEGWLAACQSGSVTALTSSAWASPCSSGVIRLGSAILAPSPSSLCPPRSSSGSLLTTSGPSLRWFDGLVGGCAAARG
jgi:hypothetical protein